MKIELLELTEERRKPCFELQVSSEQRQYIAENEASWKEAGENGKVARPFVIYGDGTMIGFAMFAFDEDYEDPFDRYWLWRFMIDERFQGKGYGTAALREIIRYFKDHGANNIRLSTKQSNVRALSLYRKAGFRETGELNGEEIVLQMDL
ncbi:MAG: GNAT family N-acetyltransferase [Erysipelotrichaceae bacterium]|nr:GNAT family N-acetyltransferase [Erysipelotrichaceae bacterium]